MSKKYLLYLGTLLLGAPMLLPGCSDDDFIDSGEYNSERLFMPMFRKDDNTNAGTSDRYQCTIASEAPASKSNYVNDIQLYWYGVNGASGYRLKAKIWGTDWETDCVLDTILAPDVLEFLHEDLQYSTNYAYAIQALSPRGEAYNSKWYGYGDGSHQKDYMSIPTGQRYDVPDVFWTEGMTKDGIRVCFDTQAEEGYADKYKAFMATGAEVVDGHWVFDEIQIVPTADNPQLSPIVHKLTEADRANGYVDFTGMESNASYVIYGQNNNLPRYFDRQYNKIMIRMPGEPGEPILIPATYNHEADSMLVQRFVPELDAARIDTVLSNYMADNTMSEGQVFYLEGGKNYYLAQSVTLTKGFTLETNPEDITAGKGRARVYMGVGGSTETFSSARAENFNLGRNAQGSAENGMMLNIADIKFNEINFGPQYFHNHMDINGTGGNTTLSLTANYFMNMNSQGLSFALTGLYITNCTMSGFVRGFIRCQGPNRQVFENFVIEGCVFHDCGVYDNNGRGYAWIAAADTKSQNAKTNVFKHFVFRNNTMIDSPRHSFLGENRNMGWPSDMTWDITIENNTFINFSTRSDQRHLFEMRYPPIGGRTHITCRKNLFVLVRKGDSDDRYLNMAGMRIENNRGVVYDFADNYATTVPTWTNQKGVVQSDKTLNDGLFNGYGFSEKNGAGHTNGISNKGGFPEARIKFGDNRNDNESDAVGYRLTPEELFKNPTPKAANGHKDMHRYDIDGFYYNDSKKVKEHPIYTKGIGDPRWRTGAPWK